MDDKLDPEEQALECLLSMAMNDWNAAMQVHVNAHAEAIAGLLKVIKDLRNKQ